MSELVLRFKRQRVTEDAPQSNEAELPSLHSSVQTLSWFVAGAHKRSSGSASWSQSQAGADAETDVNRVQQRTKQIDHGLNTLGWMRYRYLVLPHQQGSRDPVPPDPTRAHSKKLWDVVARRWRRQLHRFDLHVDPWADVGAYDDTDAQGHGAGAEHEDTPVDAVGPELQAQLQMVGCDLAYVAQTVPECSREILDVAYGCPDSATTHSTQGTRGGSGGAGQHGRKRRRAPKVYIAQCHPGGDEGEESSDGSDDDDPAVQGRGDLHPPVNSQAPTTVCRALLGPGYLHAEAELLAEVSASCKRFVASDVSSLIPGPVGALGAGAGTTKRDARLAAAAAAGPVQAGGSQAEPRDFYSALYERYHTRQAVPGRTHGGTHGGRPVHGPTVQALVHAIRPTFKPLEIPRISTAARTS